MRKTASDGADLICSASCLNLSLTRTEGYCGLTLTFTRLSAWNLIPPSPRHEP